MTPSLRRLLALFLACLSIPVLATAHTNLFYPGDAYFVSSIFRKDFGEAPDDSGSIRFGYAPLYNSRMPCGTAGYGKLEIRDPEGKLRTHLKTAADLLWKTFPQDAEDWGGFAKEEEEQFFLFIYNKDFDLLGDAIAIKYNERTDEIQKQFGVRHVVHEQFEEAQWMTVRDVLKQKEVPGLRLAEPAPEIPEFDSDDEERPTSLRDIDEPVLVDPGQIQIALLAGSEYDVVDFAEKKAGHTLLIVTASGVTRYESKRREGWQPVPLNSPRNDYIDKRRAGEEFAKVVSAAVRIFEHRHGLGTFWEYKLDGLRKKPEKPIEHPELWTPLLHEKPTCPWGHPFRYSGESHALVSPGPNGREDDTLDEKDPEYDDEYFRLDRE